jgi:tRNA uridine 5-carboxymethylaminomethyl modification enzyme
VRYALCITQTDRDLYKLEMQRVILNTRNLSVVEASVEDIVMSANDSCITGITTGDGKDPNFTTAELSNRAGRLISASKVVITTGTFLRGRIYLGKESFAAGR